MMRINRYIARCGVASRRNAEKLIEDGRISVNGRVIRDLSTIVFEDSVVCLDGAPLRMEDIFHYFAYHKPCGMITTMSDPQGRPHIGEVISSLRLPIFPVGRLDRDTSGLIILTNDGDLAHRMMHPSYELTKTYIVTIQGKPSPHALKKLRTGVDIGDYLCRPATVEIIRENKQGSTISITIYEGKNRQVRRMLKAVGHPVERLKRIKIGQISLGRLAVGDKRALTPDEIRSLKEAVMNDEATF